jgi:hypothetical protein
MSELGNLNGNSVRSDKEVGGMTEEDTGRRLARRILLGCAIVAAVLLVTGTMAALLWCH